VLPFYRLLLVAERGISFELEEKNMNERTFLAATAAICKTFLTSGCFFLLVPMALLRSLDACPKKPTCDWDDSDEAIDIWL
jgi:hypothetical protein